jgi:hypothetical protein
MLGWWRDTPGKLCRAQHSVKAPDPAWDATASKAAGGVAGLHDHEEGVFD